MTVGAPAAQYNSTRRCWQMPPNDITVTWVKNFSVLWPGIEVSVTSRFDRFLQARSGNEQSAMKARAMIQQKVRAVDARKYKVKPMKHQLEALRFLCARDAVNKRFAALFYEMGLGKSKIIIDVASILHWRKVLILMPKTLSYSWRKELDKYCCDKYAVLDATRGITSERAWKVAEFINDPKRERYIRFVFVNYDAVRSDALMKAMSAAQWDCIVADESTYIKTPAAKRTRATIKLGERAKWRVLMTGTPITNSYADLYAPLKFLSIEILGIPTFTAFKATYAVMGGYKEKQIVGWRNTEDLMEKVKQHSLIARLDDVLPNLPKAMPPIIRSVSLDEYKEVRDAYNNMRRELIHVFADGTEVTARNVLSKLIRLQQITSGFLTKGEDASTSNGDCVQSSNIIPISEPPKLQALLEVVSELGSAEKVIVGARFIYDIQQIVRALQQLGKVEVITGTVTGHKRDEALERFENGDSRFLIGTPKTFGYGLTLVKTRYLIWYSPNFSLEERQQTNARIRRPGQTRNVTYIDLVCEGTIDELILVTLMKKGDLLNYVMKQGSSIVSELPEL
jgi:SNF2 family DNA or RNA helicase